jgi:hypothetical protein
MKRASPLRLTLWAGALVLLIAVFALYLRPDMAMTLANQLWNCF